MNLKKRAHRKAKLTTQLNRMEAMEALGRPAFGHTERVQIAAQLAAADAGVLKRQFRHMSRVHRVVPEKPPLLRTHAVTQRAEAHRSSPEFARLVEYIDTHLGRGPQLAVAERIDDLYKSVGEGNGGVVEADAARELVYPILYGPLGLPFWHRQAKRNFESVRISHERRVRDRNKVFRGYWRWSGPGHKPIALKYTFYCKCWCCEHANEFNVQTGVYHGRR